MPATTIYTISGTVYDEHNSPLINVKVKLFEVDLRTEKLLGNFSVIKKGAYSLSFNWAAAADGADKSPDILIKVFSTDNKLLGQSPIYFNVKEETIIDFKLGGTPYIGLNEFDLLAQKLEPIIKPSGIKLGELLENDTYKDISFISGETREDAERITLLNTAFSFSKQTGIAPDIFYGIFRMGVPTVLNFRLAIKKANVKKAIQQAINENIISSKWEKGIDEILKEINNLSVRQLFEGSDDQARVFKKLFDTVLTKEQQKIIMSTFFNYDEEPDQFLEKIKEHPGLSDSVVNKAVPSLCLFLLTGYQPELAAQLFKKAILPY